jgi:hypothetical protein
LNFNFGTRIGGKNCARTVEDQCGTTKKRRKWCQ